MRLLPLPAFAAMAILSSCNAEVDATPEGQRGQSRYAGVGVYTTGPLWGKMLGAPNPADPATAKITDDEHVIVVVDTRTGEIRQCGDHSGFCVAISPWPAGQSAGTLPAKLSSHGDDNTVATPPK